MDEQGLEIIKLRNDFYRDNYKRVVIVLLLSVFINVFLAFVIFYQIKHLPSPKYFASTEEGGIIPLYPLDEPIVSPSELLQWATRAAVSAYTYNFVNYREELQDVQKYFTPDGWGNFEDALRGSRTLETGLAKKLVVSAVATGAPVILQQGVINGAYSWKIQLPILVSYQSASEQTQQPLVVTMIISRVPTLNTPRGISIVSSVSSG